MKITSPAKPPAKMPAFIEDVNPDLLDLVLKIHEHVALYKCSKSGEMVWSMTPQQLCERAQAILDAVSDHERATL